MFEIRHYLTADGRNQYLDWLKRVRDPIAKGQIVKRVNRVGHGNFGDHKPCRDGVWEMRIDVGAGYRVYYALAGSQVILLLRGGDKQTRDADIDHAIRNWRDCQGRARE